MWDPYAEFESVILPNGLSVHAAHLCGRPFEAVGFLIHSGAEHDPIGLEGLAHFTEHLVSENSPIPKSDMRLFFGEHGGTINLGSTTYSHTFYNFFLPSDMKILAESFSMLGPMFFLAQLENFIERERKVIVSEFYRAYPLTIEFDLDVRQRRAVHHGSWLERFVRPLGNLESIERITQTDLQSYYDTHYTPANMSIVGVGGISLLELVDLLSESTFAICKEGTRTPLPLSVVNDVLYPLENRLVFDVSKYISTGNLNGVGGYLSVARMPGNINPAVFFILKHMLDEALNQEIRQRRGWVYSINSSWSNFRQFYELSIHCNGLATEAIHTIDEVIDHCISLIQDDDFFQVIKRRAIASHSLLDLNGRDILKSALSDLGKYHRIIPLSEFINCLNVVTLDDICSLLGWFRSERRWTLITQP